MRDRLTALWRLLYATPPLLVSFSVIALAACLLQTSSLAQSIAKMLQTSMMATIHNDIAPGIVHLVDVGGELQS